MAWILGTCTQSVSMEHQLGVSHLGQIQTWEDVYGVALGFGYVGVEIGMN